VRPIWPAGEPQWVHPWQRGFFSIIDYGADERALTDKEWLAGTNIAFRRDALLDVGGFAESLGRTGSALLSNEELSTTERLHGIGHNAIHARLAYFRRERARVGLVQENALARHFRGPFICYVRGNHQARPQRTQDTCSFQGVIGPDLEDYPILQRYDRIQKFANFVSIGHIQLLSRI
jgi:hypothetical protein